MSYISPEGIVIPAGGDNWNLTTDLRTQAASTRSVVTAANRTAADAIATAMSADGRAVSATNPLVVFNQARRALEVKDNVGWVESPVAKHAEYTSGTSNYPNSAATYGPGVFTVDSSQTFSSSFISYSTGDQLNILETGIYLIDWGINTTSLPPGGEMVIKNLGTGFLIGTGDLSRTVTWGPRVTAVGYLTAGQALNFYTINRLGAVSGTSRVKVTKLMGF